MLENVAFDEVTRRRPRRRPLHGEHARVVSARLHRQRGSVADGRPSEQRRAAHVRRAGRAAADRAADPGAGALPLRLRLHVEDRGHRGGARPRAGDHVQHLLRRAVHGPPSDRLRRPAAAEDRAARRPLLARQHRLDGRARSASASGSASSTRAGCWTRPCPAPSTRSTTASTRSSASRCPSTAPGSRTTSSGRRRPGRARTSTGPATASSRRGTSGTSASSPGVPAGPGPGGPGGTAGFPRGPPPSALSGGSSWRFAGSGVPAARVHARSTQSVLSGARCRAPGGGLRPSPTASVRLRLTRLRPP